MHDIRNYPAEDIRFGMRYADAVTTADDGTPVLDLKRIGELEPDVGDRPEQGWTEREETYRAPWPFNTAALRQDAISVDCRKWCRFMLNR